MLTRRLTAFVLAVLFAACMNTPSDARPHHKRHHQFQTISSNHRGACDGIHRCRCGSTQANYFGLPRIYNGHNLWRAAEWPAAFPHTSPHVGAVGYQHGGGPSGHVFRIVSYEGGCRATVADDAGQYDRNICSRGAIFVDVNKRWAKL